MKIQQLKDCIDKVPKDCRLMGLDLGTKTIGVAISNSMQTISTPVTTIKRSKFSKDVIELHKIIKDYEIGGYIIGYPVNIDGSEGARCDASRSFADQMSKTPEVFGQNPFIALQDEALSTEEVDNFLDNRVDMKKSSKRGAKDSGLIDQLAAQIILQSAINHINS